MSTERNIIKRLMENTKIENTEDLDEAGFDANGSHYSCAFGKYTKDGESITREEYFKAKDGSGNKESSKEDDIETLKGMLSREAEIKDHIMKHGFDKSMHLKDEYHELTSKIGALASKIDGPNAIHGKGILYKLSSEEGKSDIDKPKTKPSTKKSKSTPIMKPAEVDKYAGEWKEKSGDKALDKAYGTQRDKYAMFKKTGEALSKASKSIENNLRREMGLPPKSKDHGRMRPELRKAIDTVKKSDPKYVQANKDYNKSVRAWEKSCHTLKDVLKDAKARGVKYPHDYYVASTEWDDAD